MKYDSQTNPANYKEIGSRDGISKIVNHDRALRARELSDIEPFKGRQLAPLDPEDVIAELNNRICGQRRH